MQALLDSLKENNHLKEHHYQSMKFTEFSRIRYAIEREAEEVMLKVRNTEQALAVLASEK